MFLKLHFYESGDETFVLTEAIVRVNLYKTHDPKKPHAGTVIVCNSWATSDDYIRVRETPEAILRAIYDAEMGTIDDGPWIEVKEAGE